MHDMQITPWRAEGNTGESLIKLIGEIDYTNSIEVRDWLFKFCDNLKSDLKLDLSMLKYIDSSGLAVFIELRKLLIEKKLSIRITSITTQVGKLFSLTQIGELFGI